MRGGDIRGGGSSSGGGSGGGGGGSSGDDAISLSQHRLFISEFLKN